MMQAKMYVVRTGSLAGPGFLGDEVAVADDLGRIGDIAGDIAHSFLSLILLHM